MFLYKERFGTEYVYDEKGNRKKRTSSAGNAGGSTYDEYNNVLTSKAPGRTAATAYDWGSGEAQLRKHLLRSIASPLGTHIAYQYDAYGSPTQVKMQESAAGTAKYTQADIVYTAAGTYAAAQTDARGKTATTVTDPNKGIVTKVTDPAGQEVNSQYDTLRRLTKTSTMLTATQEVKTENAYQAQTGYLASTTHNTDSAAANDVTYHFSYDSLGRQVSVAVGSNVLSTTYYDAVLRAIDHAVFGPVSQPVGSVCYTCDSFARVTGIRYDNETSDRFTYGYDAQGRVAYVADHTRETTAFTDYDLAGRPCRKTLLAGTAHCYTGELSYNSYELPHEFTEYVGPARAKHVTGFGYDIENRVTALTYTGVSMGYTYDALGRITQRILNAGTTPVETAYTYVPGAYGTNSTTGLIQTLSQNGVTLTYQYDDRGNITSVSDGTKTASYVYDAIGQLIRVNDETDITAGSIGTTWVFTYDLGGNILTKTAYPYTTETVGTAAESHTYTYGNTGWKDQLTALDGVTITYDAIGNPLTDGTWSYTWQHGKQLAQMQKTEAGVTTTVSFEYNEDGLRTKKTVMVGENTTITEYTLHGKNVVHLIRGADELHFYYDAQDKPAIVVYNGTAYGYLYNLQGDVAALVDGTGTKVVEYSYDAWGKPTGKTGTMAGTLGTVQPFRYRGYVWDEETGDYYLRSRYYRAEWGRFVNSDIILSENLYCYTDNAVVAYADDTGTDGARVSVANPKYNETITPGMRALLGDPPEPMLGYYIARGRNKKGGMDCVWGYKEAEEIPKRRVYTVNNIWRWYANRKTKRGWIGDRVDFSDLQPGDLVFSIDPSDPNYNSQDKISRIDHVLKGHIGIVVLFDFGDGEEKAVFQCCSVRLSEDKWKALFYNDTGPNITALKRNDGHTNWRFYIRP